MRIILVLAVATATVGGQAPTRRATNIAALAAHPAFYHQRPIVIVGTITLANSGEMRVADAEGSVRLVYRGSVPDGPAEVRGEFWDLGRMNADDPRLSAYDLATTFRIDPEGSWPRPGAVTAIVASAVAPATTPGGPSLRTIVLYPTRYLDQRVTLTGQFAGRNLLGDLPEAPGVSRYDFVVRSADAALWVANLRPRGRDFELALDARIDTGRWLEVTGTLRQARGLLWLDGTAGSLRLTKPAADLTSSDPPVRVPAAAPPEILFSAPTGDESDVSTTTNVRIQFSRDIDPATLKDRVRVRYMPGDAALAGTPVPPIEFTTQYQRPTRVLEIRFANPLDAFRVVEVELADGVLGADQQPLIRWTLRFTTGGS